MQELVNIYKNIKTEFCSLWKFRERGETLEIITPYTTSDKFVSVFLTVRNKEFIISDGGWLNDGTYETAVDLKDESFKKLFHYYKDFFDINEVVNNKITYYFKKTKKKELIPNLVFDITNFISTIASSSKIQFIEAKEKQQTEMFNKQANTFLTAIVSSNDSGKVQFRKSIDDKMKSVTFSAIVNKGSHQLTLVNYITGSNQDYFMGSIAKAHLAFEVVKTSKMNSHIQKKIAIIDDTANGFKEEVMRPLLYQLKKSTENNNFFWHQRENLKKVV